MKTSPLLVVLGCAKKTCIFERGDLINAQITEILLGSTRAARHACGGRWVIDKEGQ